MPGELETVVREMMSAFDREDFETVGSFFTDDAQGVDELSRKWMRGRQGIADYFSQFGPVMSDVRSNISDLHETDYGETGIVTCWMEQDYKIQGQPTHFSGPMTVVLRRENGEWRIALVHAVPLPPA